MATKDGLRAREIGKRIALARNEAGGMTQRELADLIGVTERSVSAYERGEVVPFRFIRKLEDALAKPAAWFLYGEEIEQVSPNEVIANQKIILKKLDKILEALAVLTTK